MEKKVKSYDSNYIFNFFIDTVQPKHIAFGEKILIPPHILQYTSSSSTSGAVSRTTSSQEVSSLYFYVQTIVLRIIALR